MEEKPSPQKRKGVLIQVRIGVDSFAGQRIHHRGKPARCLGFALKRGFRREER